MDRKDSIAQKALVIAIGAGYLRFSWIRPLECSCLCLCLESRRHVARSLRVTTRTPRWLWCRSFQASAERESKSADPNSDPDRETARDIMHQAPWVYRSPMLRSAAGTPTALMLHGNEGRCKAPAVLHVLWKLPESELLVPGLEWAECVKELSFLMAFRESPYNLPLPEFLEGLRFDLCFDKSLSRGQIRWPKGLKRLSFGAKWNQPLVDAKETWPSSLQSLRFGTRFNQPLSGDGVGLPTGLRELSLGDTFNQPLSGVDWPPGLEKLVLSRHFNKPLKGICWPISLKELIFGDRFEQDIMDVRWPRSLEVLEFGKSFNQPLQEGSDGASLLPDGLRKLELGRAFCQDIGRATLPAELREFRCRGSCSFKVRVEWPSRLRAIYCGTLKSTSLPPRLEWLVIEDEMAGSLSDMVFPASLIVLDLGSRYNHPLKAVRLPDGLQELRLGTDFDSDIRDARLPRGLKRLCFSDDSTFNQKLKGMHWPAGLEEVHFGRHYDQPLKDTTFPQLLKKLHFGAKFSDAMDGARLPETLESLSFMAQYPWCHLRSLSWPRCMRSLTWGSQHFSTQTQLSRAGANQVLRSTALGRRETKQFYAKRTAS